MLKYRDFCDFQDGGRRHLGFSKIPNFKACPLSETNMRHFAEFHRFSLCIITNSIYLLFITAFSAFIF